MYFSFPKSTLLSLAAVASFAVAQDCGSTWKCYPVSGTTPQLDGDLSEWNGVEAFTTDLVQALTKVTYDAGSASHKCQYDSDKIYLAIEIPGEYRFNANNDHQCASIATMTKVGSMAQFENMGACPDAMSGCTADGAIPDTCTDYRVDIGAHWELSATSMNTEYTVGDEYAASPYCRLSDDDAEAGQEWSGAWSHTNPVDGEFGNYTFELSRTLTTPSTFSDAQIVAGETIQFGVAFWDPFVAEEGWDDVTHFVTGCASNWVDLELVVMNTTMAIDGNDTATTTNNTSWATTNTTSSAMDDGSSNCGNTTDVACNNVASNTTGGESVGVMTLNSRSGGASAAQERSFLVAVPATMALLWLLL